MESSQARIGAEEIEGILGQIAEIKAARVVEDSHGEILEIHVLALPSKTPKQLVRDIESSIMATYGVAVDHKKISIAQLGQESMPALESNGSSDTPRARIHSISANVSGVHAAVSVELELEGELYKGESSGPASQTGRQRLIALATLNAVEQYLHGAQSFALEDVALSQLGRERVAVACVVLVTALGEQAFAGSALVRQNEKDSIVRATLDAINRRIGFLTST